MQPSEFRQPLVSFCEVAKLKYQSNENEISITMDDAINHGKMTELCDSWYSDHDSNRMVFKIDTGLVYTLTEGEFDTYQELIQGMPMPLVTAQYGVKKIDTRMNRYYITFMTSEDAFNMSFLLINHALDFNNEEAL